MYPKSVIITIDDAPNFPEQTSKILDVLDRHNAKCTFFCIGEYIESNDTLLKRMKKDSFGIANHSYTHSDFQTMSNDEVKQELDRTQDLLKEYTDMRYFRPPYGSITDEQIAWLFTKGYDAVMWDWNAEDWDTNKTIEQIKEYYIDKLENNDIVKPIVLFHLSDNSIICLDWLLTELEKRNIKTESLWKNN